MYALYGSLSLLSLHGYISPHYLFDALIIIIVIISIIIIIYSHHYHHHHHHHHYQYYHNHLIGITVILKVMSQNVRF